MTAGLYRLGVEAYHAGLRAAAGLGNARAREWVRGRRENAAPPAKTEKRRLWVHCASLGEWEQGRPVVEAWRALHPDWEVVLTFFSPSGYTRRHDDPAADHVRYLPEDTPRRAAAWVAGLRPDLAIFVKYEFWFFHLRALRRAGVPTFLVAASFRLNQRFFTAWGGWWRGVLGLFSGIICQTQRDAGLLAGPGGYPAERIVVHGDPRVDRVLELAATPFQDPVLDAFCRGGKLILLAGSTWPPDLRILREAWPELREHYRLIIAPHQINEEELARTQVQWKALRHGHGAGATQPSESDVLIIDGVGILSRAYRYADVAYVGGAFKTGLHNTLEPMAYGLPTLFGPKHGKFPEASRAMEAGGAFSVSTAEELRNVLHRLADDELRGGAGQAQQRLARASAGAAQKTAHYLAEFVHATRPQP